MTDKMPTETPGDADTTIEVNDGQLAYSSAAGEGRVEIEVPGLAGSPNAVERLHAVAFGEHVVSRIESAFGRNPYLKSGPQQRPDQVFKHYTAVARGAGLMDEGALKRMEQLGAEFAEEPEREEFFKQIIRPYLLSLTPKRR